MTRASGSCKSSSTGCCRRRRSRDKLYNDAMPEIRFITLNPGHFHAALVQKEMYPKSNISAQMYILSGRNVTEQMATHAAGVAP